MAKDEKPKILRVGIIQGGRIVEERLLRKRESVTIGQASRNTFIVPVAQFAKSATLFEMKGGRYSLVYDEKMEGRVSLGDQVLDLKGIAKSGKAHRRGHHYHLPLDDRSRGKLVVAPFTLLFQFVEPPPVLPKPQLPAAARGGLAQRYDWTFLNILIASFLIQGGTGAGLDVWWRQSGRYLQDQYGVRKTKAYEQLKAEVLRQKEEEPEPEEEESVEDPTDLGAEEAPEAKEPEPEPVKPEPVKKPAKAAPKADKASNDGATAKERKSARDRAIRDKVTKTTWIRGLGSKTDGEEGEAGGLAPLGAGVSTASLDDAFNDASGAATVAAAGETKTFVGTPVAAGKSGDGAYKRLGKGEGGSGTRIATKPVKTTEKKTEKKLDLRIGGGTVSGKSGTGKIDKSQVQKVFSRRKGAIKYCYEKALKKNSSVKGKVTIRFTIGPAGRITSASVAANTTGDSAIGQCIVGKVKSWRFPPPEGGSATFSFPFVLSTGG